MLGRALGYNGMYACVCVRQGRKALWGTPRDQGPRLEQILYPTPNAPASPNPFVPD